MLDDIPDDELSAALMDENDSLVDIDSEDDEDDDYNFNDVESESESSDSDFDSGASASDGSDDDDDDDEADNTSSLEEGFKTPESKKSKLTLPGGHVLK